LDCSDYSYQLFTTLSYVRPNDPMMTIITPVRQPGTRIFLCDELAGRKIGDGCLNKFENNRGASMESRIYPVHLHYITGSALALALLYEP
jgi:hypothetical protein